MHLTGFLESLEFSKAIINYAVWQTGMSFGVTKEPMDDSEMDSELYQNFDDSIYFAYPKHVDNNAAHKI